MMEKYCQSCGMPLEEELLGTNQDGSKNQDYCKYCFSNGTFVGESTMEDMINFCVPIMIKQFPDKNEETIRSEMMAWFPTLKRWKQA